MTTYNGWTNYETWRVKLEIFEDEYPIIEMLTGGAADMEDALEMLEGEACASFADEIIFGDFNRKEVGLMAGYANAFLSEVNWDEIAECLAETLTDDPEHFGFEGVDDE